MAIVRGKDGQGVLQGFTCLHSDFLYAKRNESTRTDFCEQNGKNRGGRACNDGFQD